MRAKFYDGPQDGLEYHLIREPEAPLLYESKDKTTQYALSRIDKAFGADGCMEETAIYFYVKPNKKAKNDDKKEAR